MGGSKMDNVNGLVKRMVDQLHGSGVSGQYRKFVFQDNSTLSISDVSRDPVGFCKQFDVLKIYTDLMNLMDGNQFRGLWNRINLELINIGKTHATERLKEVASELGYKPLVNIRSDKTEDIRLYDLRRKRISDISWCAFRTKYHKDEVAALRDSVDYGHFFFHPNKPHLEVIEEDGDSIWHVNTYIRPLWLDNKPSQDCKIPPRIDFLLDHLFPCPQSRQYALGWLYNAITARNETYLVLNGRKGIGKGLFEKLVMALVGSENSAIPSHGFLNKEFNSIMRNKRLIILDEVKMTTENLDKLKRYINDRISIEAKGSDASSHEENFCSFIISNNKMTDTLIEYDDRRFSVVDVTTQLLTKQMSLESIRNLDHEFMQDDSEEIAEFGHWLLESFSPLISTHEVYKGETFWKLVYSGLLEWQKMILDDALLGSSDSVEIRSYRSTKLLKQGVKFPTNADKIQDFLENYRHLGKIYIGKFIVDRINGDRIDFTPEIRSLKSKEELVSCI